MRVLVADDAGLMRKIMMRALNAAGVDDVTEAVDGDEAVAKFRTGEFDLVLTDWNMPGRSGLEVAEAIRATDSNIPIIMITTECEKRRVLRAIQAGVNDYLTKPFDKDTLKEKIEKFVSCST